YGMRRLRDLASTKAANAGSSPIQSLAAEMLARENAYSRNLPDIAADRIFANVRIFPAGRALPPELSGRLSRDWMAARKGPDGLDLTPEGVIGLFVDLDGDGKDEFVVFGPNGGLLYRQELDAWSVATRVGGACCNSDWKGLVAD